jgi:plasmid maintenance system antidote protein VapI
MTATPSKMLKDWCSTRNITRRQMAAQVGCSPAAVQFIINGTMRVGADMAIKLEHVTHIPAVDWLVAQAHADLSKARKA